MKRENARYISVETAARVLCKSPGTLNNYRFFGKGPPYIKSNNGHVLYDIRDLHRYMEDNKVYPEGRPDE